MHEIQFAKNIVKVLEDQINDPEVGEVKKVHLEVGKLHYIIPEILNTGFSNVPKDEKLKNAKLEIEVIPVKVKCLSCGKETVAEGSDFTCGECSGAKTEIVSGKEFMVKGIEW